MIKLLRKNRHVHIPSLMKSNMPHEQLPSKVQDIMQLVQLSKEDLHSLHLIDDIMEKHATTIAERHYNMIMDIPDVKDIFSKFTTYESYVPAITNYYKQLTKPNIDQHYIDSRKAIGKIHSEIQLEEDWFIGSYIRIYEYLVPHISVKFASQPTKLTNILLALNRIITFDTIIVLDAYREANEF